MSCLSAGAALNKASRTSKPPATTNSAHYPSHCYVPNTPHNMKNEDIVRSMFTQIAGNRWKCDCGKELTGNKTGWTNLMSHVHKEHAEALEILKKLLKTSARESLGILNQKKVRASSHGWK